MFTGWSISANQKKVFISSILMFFYMTTYLLILDSAFKDSNSKLMIITYAISCGIGNFLRVKKERDKQ
jgi:hypothetical protein